MEQVVNCLGLHMLHDDEVHRQWKDGYFDDATLPAALELHLELINVPDILLRLTQSIFVRIKTGAATGWPGLVQEGLDFKRFLYLIHCLMCSAMPKLEEEQHRTIGIIAARTYLSFLAVPHGSPFLIYQLNLYSKALQILQCGYLRRKPTSHGRGHSSSIRQSSDDIQSSQESENLLRLLIDAELELITVLKTSDVDLEKEAVELTVETLSNIAMQEVRDSSLLSNGLGEMEEDRLRYSAHSLELNAFRAILALCTKEHGDVEETVRIVMRFVFEAFMLGFNKNDSKSLSTTDVSIIRNVFKNFVSIMCDSVGQKAQEGILILTQQLCLHAPVRAEYRSKFAESVTHFIVDLPLSYFVKAGGVVIILSCHDKASIRLFAIEVLGRTLSALKVLAHLKAEYKLHRLLFSSVLARVQDLSAVVRFRAMSCLVSYIKETPNIESSRSILKEIFIDPYATVSPIEVSRKDFKNFNKIAEALQSGNDLPAVSLPCAQTIIDELCEHCDDNKVLVRKTALQLLVRIFHLNKKFITQDLLVKIGSHCRDQSTAVKKLMVQELTNLLLEYPSNQMLIRQWTMDVVPSVFDSENTVVENVLESLVKTILDNMVSVTQLQTPKHHLPWFIMDEIFRLQYQKAFWRACSLWKEERLKSSTLISILKSHIGIEKPHNSSAWVTLMCLAEFMTIKNPTFVLNFYHEEICGKSNVNNHNSQVVMEVLWLTWKQLSAEEKSCLANELHTDLISFKFPVPLISRAVDIRYGLHVGDNEGIDVDDPPDWAKQLIKECELKVWEALRLESKRIQNEEEMKRFVITLGNICLFYPSVVETKMVDQLLLMLSPSDEGGPELWVGSCGRELKAALIVTLGKIGLQCEPMALKLINQLGTMLSTTKESHVKNNIVICLTDLCVRYSSLGDHLLPDMCVCLKDALQPVRQTTLKLLVQLIQEDYIKLRHNLTFHLLSMLNDEDFNIVNMTQVFFIDSVLKKKSNCFAMCFVPSIFHFNGYERLSDVPLTKQEKEVFNISGPHNKFKRYKIYRFMVRHSTDHDRITLVGQMWIDICKEVLEQKLPLDVIGEEVLRDCLYVMNYDEIHTMDGEDDDENLIDDEDTSEMVINIAHKKIYSEVWKQRILNTGIPILCKLRKKLACMKSHLSKDVGKVLKNMIHSHKIDIDDLKDPILIKELRQEDSESDSHESDASVGDSENS